MSYPSLIAVIISLGAIVLFGYKHNLDETLAFAAGQALIVSMIIFGRFWAKYVLTAGFMASLAKDADQAHHSAAAITLLGWIALIILTYIGIF